MIGDFPNEVYMTSSGEGSSDLPVSRRLHTEVSPAPATTTRRSKDAPATQTMMIVPAWMLAPQSDIGLPLEQRHAFQEGQQERAHAQQANVEHEAAQQQVRNHRGLAT
jgi:hypothetical protein